MLGTRGSGVWFVLCCIIGCQAPAPVELERAVASAVSPELEIDEPVPRPGGVQASVEAAASNGSNFLLVWRQEENRLFAARFAQDGSPLEPVSHALDIASSGGAEVASRGAGYVIAWTDAGRVFASRMNAAGDTVGVPVMVAQRIEADGDVSITRPGLAVSGNRIIVVWSVGRAGSDLVRGRLFDLSLAAVGPAFDVDTQSAAAGAPVVASNGTNFFAAWQVGDQVRGTRITSGGIVVDSGGIAISPSTHSVFGRAGIAYGGGQYLVIWRRGTNSRIYGRRYTPAGISLDSTPFEFTDGPNDFIFYPGHQAVFDGDRFVVSWIDDRDGSNRVYATRLGTDGVIDPVGGAPVDDDYATSPTAAASAGGVTLIAHNGSFSLSAADGSTITDQPVPMAWRYNHQTTPFLCRSPGGHLAVWRDDRIEPGIYAAPLDEQGPPSGDAQLVTTALAEPIVACGAGVHLVAWRDDSDLSVDVLAMRVGDDGVPLDTAPIDLGDSAAEPPAVASSGSDFLVVWSNGSDVFGRRVAAGGSLPDVGPFPIATALGAQFQPSLAFGDGLYLAAWGDNRGGLSAVYGARIDPDGTVLDLVGVPIGDLFFGDDAPVVAHGPAEFLVAWQSAFGGLSARVVGLDGSPVGPERLVLETPAGWGRLDAAWDGSSFVLVAAADDVVSDIVMGRLDQTGASLSLPGQSVATGQVERVTNPVVSASASGQLVVGYERSATLGDRPISRVRMVGVTFDVAGEPCASDVMCASGHCVDGVCCDLACGDGDPSDCQACSVAGGAESNGVCGPVAAGDVCRPAAGDCDVAEACDGVDLQCPGDQWAGDGADCSDTNACTTGDSCVRGTCVGSDAVDCTSDEPCQVGSCQTTTGECSFDPVEDGTSCPPPDACTVSAACVAGECQAGPPVECPPPPACQTSDGCNPSTGLCQTSPVADGTPCIDGICQGGTCAVPPSDAGPTEPGPADAGADAGQPAGDAGHPAADAGHPDDSSSSGCGCRASGSDGKTGMIALLALAWAGLLVRRRYRM